MEIITVFTLEVLVKVKELIFAEQFQQQLVYYKSDRSSSYYKIL